MRRNICLLFLFLCLNATLLTAQTPFFQQYHPLKKNQPIQVNALLQDRKGFVWFGTDKGLFRFDGLHYKQYSDLDSLPDEQITALAEDSVGRLWIGHASGLISYMDKGIMATFETREGSAVEPISDILFDSKGTMWFGTRNDGLYYFRNERLHRIDEQEGLPDLFVYDLHEDPAGNIWAATDGGIAVCTLVEGHISIDVINTDDGLPDIIIRKIKPFRGDTLGLATEDAGILAYNLTTKKIAPLSTTAWEFGTITDFVVKENQLWIATPRSGLVVYDNEYGHVKVLRDFNGLSLLSVNTLLKDREGNIWSGSKTGLSRTLGDALEHIDLDGSAGNDNVLAIAVDYHNRIWYSTR
jgi:ligand-binding sensor domain-containing protein